MAGASIAGVVGSLVGLALPAAAIGCANGALSGNKQTYHWSSRRGCIAFVLDSSWSLLNTGAGLVSHLANALHGTPEYVPALSRRQNRHVYAKGRTPRPGFAVTMGNVVSGAGANDSPSRTALVTDHEDVHIWQARWLGPVYPVLYVGWSALGGIAGFVLWVKGHREQPMTKVVETVSYYMNPLEWWAYSRHGHWPPSGMLDGLGWKRPVVSSLATLRAGAARSAV